MNKTITVSTGAIAALRKAHKRMIRAAARMGVEMTEAGLVIDWQTKREEMKTTHYDMRTEDGIQPMPSEKRLVEVVDVSLDLPDIGAAAGQWTVAGLISKVDHEAGSVAQGENEIFTEHADVRAAYRTTKLFCDHCRANRHRVRTLACREVSSRRLIQVGVECAVNYVRDADKEIAALEFQEFVGVLLSDFEDGNERHGGGRSLTAFDAEEVVAMTLKVIRDCGGYQPSKLPLKHGDFGDAAPNPAATWREVEKRIEASEPGDGTKEATLQAYRVANPPAKTGHAELDASLARNYEDELLDIEADKFSARKAHKDWLNQQPTADDGETAKKVLAWLAAAPAVEWPKCDPYTGKPDREISFDERRKCENGDFLRSLKAAFAPGWVSNKRLAFACCVCRAYDRALDEAAKQANPPTEKGPVGRIPVRGVIKSTKLVQTDFGDTWKMLVELESRARVYCSIPQGCNGNIGETVHFVATFERSQKDEYFSFGSRPKLYVEKPAKVKKAKAPITEPVAEPEPAAMALAADEVF